MAEDGLLGAAGDAAQPAPAQQQAEAGDCPGPAAAAAGPAAAASPQEQQQDAGLSSASPETPAIGEARCRRLGRECIGAPPSRHMRPGLASSAGLASRPLRCNRCSGDTRRRLQLLLPLALSRPLPHPNLGLPSTTAGPEAWAAQRRAWANPRKRRAGGEGGSPEQLAARQAAIPPDADYDSLLGPPYQQFSAPIPLPEMIEFLTDCWALAIGLD